ncbi:MAG: IS200/IS605 family element RNA-guided endonuclease TnpB [Olsenella sp.]|nr:IS200/IS605 family element RNA-guided endonuclease TnpB [Olsenella sp.]
MDMTFEYRIYPSAAQRVQLARTFGCCRWVYNRVLQMRKEEYERDKKTRSINSYITQIPIWKKDEAPWLAEADSMALQQSLRDLDKAYKNFFRSPGRVGFPRFKSKSGARQSYRTNSISIVDARHVKLPKLGSVRARITRPVRGRILSATVKKVPSGEYFVAVCCTDCPEPDMPQGDVEVMGIDAGIRCLMARSDGKAVASPKSLTKSEKRLAREQRRLSRKKKGSNRRSRQRVRVARIHEKIANQRKDAIHKATTEAVRESQAIAVEDLNVKGMEKNRRLARAVADASMSEIIRQLQYKCAWYGRAFVKVGRFYPSSKTCSCCGYVNKNVVLGVESWTCPECGARHDRDLNAAKNIAAEGARLLAEGNGTAGLAGTGGARVPRTLVEQA